MTPWNILVLTAWIIGVYEINMLQRMPLTRTWKKRRRRRRRRRRGNVVA
jgi:hypothetical protein